MVEVDRKKLWLAELAALRELAAALKDEKGFIDMHDFMIALYEMKGIAENVNVTYTYNQLGDAFVYVFEKAKERADREEKEVISDCGVC